MWWKKICIWNYEETAENCLKPSFSANPKHKLISLQCQVINDKNNQKGKRVALSLKMKFLKQWTRRDKTYQWSWTEKDEEGEGLWAQK